MPRFSIVGVAVALALAGLATTSLPAADAAPRFGQRPLKLGKRGYDVKLLEWKLQNRRFHPGRVDGVFDGRTRAAVRRYRASRGLAPKGRVTKPVYRRIQRERRRFDVHKPLPPRYNLVPASSSYGNATWYGPGFDGAHTASGERFNRWGMTAAHRWLPFGTLVRVTYRGRSVIVKINDRGPFSSHHTIDLAQGAKLALHMPDTTTVRLTVLKKVPIRVR
jgi:peptidoglycan hydrolase-like protein with peptidoglycan-binding domain